MELAVIDEILTKLLIESHTLSQADANNVSLKSCGCIQIKDYRDRICYYYLLQ